MRSAPPPPGGTKSEEEEAAGAGAAFWQRRRLLRWRKKREEERRLNYVCHVWDLDYIYIPPADARTPAEPKRAMRQYVPIIFFLFSAARARESAPPRDRSSSMGGRIYLVMAKRMAIRAMVCNARWDVFLVTWVDVLAR